MSVPAVTTGVEYVTFSDVQPRMLATLSCSVASRNWLGSLYDSEASSVPNVGMTPVFVPERK